jgi:hypothetical protein
LWEPSQPRQHPRVLAALPAATIATDDEVLACIERNHLYGTGSGYTDVHLLASAMLTPTRPWTLDDGLSAMISVTLAARDQACVTRG